MHEKDIWILKSAELLFFTPNDVLVLLLSFMETNSIKKMETKKYIQMTIAFMDA